MQVRTALFGDGDPATGYISHDTLQQRRRGLEGRKEFMRQNLCVRRDRYFENSRHPEPSGTHGGFRKPLETEYLRCASRTRRSSTRLRVFQTDGQELLLRNEVGVGERVGSYRRDEGTRARGRREVPPRRMLRILRLFPNSRQVLKARRHGYQRILHPPSTPSQNRTTVGLVTTRQRRLYHDGPVWPCTHALYPCIRRPPPRKHQRLPA
jgi:hypothetical protein